MQYVYHESVSNFTIVHTVAPFRAEEFARFARHRYIFVVAINDCAQKKCVSDKSTIFSSACKLLNFVVFECKCRLVPILQHSMIDPHFKYVLKWFDPVDCEIVSILLCPFYWTLWLEISLHTWHFTCVLLFVLQGVFCSFISMEESILTSVIFPPCSLPTKHIWRHIPDYWLHNIQKLCIHTPHIYTRPWSNDICFHSMELFQPHIHKSRMLSIYKHSHTLSINKQWAESIYNQAWQSYNV